ncbi:MAG TPA: sigma 54-interacting transcriptional regulator [Vicinamibacterales bacterium]|nr:sigma 54-interacting transcriptional regulator [Vicinamibacterales bacterium]
MDTITAPLDEPLATASDRLIAEMSALLVRADGDEIITAVEDALRRIGQSFEVDRCVLLVSAAGGALPETTFQWVRQDAAPVDPEADIAALRMLVDAWRSETNALALERIPDDLPVDVLAAIPDEALSRITVRSGVIVRIVVPSLEGPFACALMTGLNGESRCWPDPLVERLQILASLFASALARRRQEQALHQSHVEIARLRSRVDDHGESSAIVVPRTSIVGFEEIVGNSPALRTALGLLQEVADTDSTALLLGETGTGKELFAKALHARSSRRQFPIVCVNCAALPPTLIESELFGHERGAFTDAVAQRQGRFELAHRGTLFLDEIGDLPLELQAKLLRVLQEGEFERLGTSRTKKVDVRIVAATHRELGRAVADGEFREDLYYRLNVFPIRLPPLRERREDIPALVWATIHRRQHAMHRSIARIPNEVMDALQRHPWPGNIRQLENVVERALIHSTADTLVLVPGELEDVPESPEDTTSLAAIERSHIERILRECGGRINGPGNTAERLGLHPNTLRFRMKKLGIMRSARASTPLPRSPLERTS